MVNNLIHYEIENEKSKIVWTWISKINGMKNHNKKILKFATRNSQLANKKNVVII